MCDLTQFDLPAGARAKCDSCGETFTEDYLDPIADIGDRLDPGGTVPAGQCPECGALCYLDDMNARDVSLALTRDEAKVLYDILAETLHFVRTDTDPREERRLRDMMSTGTDLMGRLAACDLDGQKPNQPKT